jgi:A/G-specific adenine glycosylase
MNPPNSTVSALDPARIEALQMLLLEWYDKNRRVLPWRFTADPYAILVSEVMLQQTQVSRVLPRFAGWLEAWPDLESLAAAPLADVLRLWQGLGYNTRARRLRDCAVAVTDAGQRPPVLPRSLDALRALPGVGQYTARAVLIFAHNDDLAAVDANVRRVLTHQLRLPLDLPARDVQAVADVVLPHGRSRDWHNAIMDYGSLVLTARVTGIAPRTRQRAFEGSPRQRRARLLRVLLERGPLSLADARDALALPRDELEALVAALCRDGLVRLEADRLSVA